MNTEKRTLGDLMTALFEKHPESRDDFTILLYMLAGSMARITELEEKLEEHNRDIKQHFYKKDLWKALQHYDSRIASDVLATCMERNICVLPYHDSFRVEEGSAEILYGVLYESWKRVLGNTNNCVVERK